MSGLRPHDHFRPAWRRGAATGAILTGISIGLRSTLSDDQPEVPIVVPVRQPPENAELRRITVYFHPDVPEATLVLLSDDDSRHE